MTISGTAAAASSLFTVIRTIWEPAFARAATCAAVRARIGRVGVRHRLDDDGLGRADEDAADVGGDGVCGGAGREATRRQSRDSYGWRQVDSPPTYSNPEVARRIDWTGEGLAIAVGKVPPRFPRILRTLWGIVQHGG